MIKTEAVYNFIDMFEKSIELEEPWKVVKAEFEPKDKAVHIYVEGRKTSKYPCPQCKKLSVRYDEEEEERVWRHADVVMYPCYIHCRRPRINCKEHGIHVVDAPWARRGARQTFLFEGYAMMLSTSMSLNEARRLLRISRTALMHIVEYWVEKAVSEANLSMVEQISIDETSFKRGQSYVTVIGDPPRHRVIGVEDGRDMAAVERFSLYLEAKGGDCNKVRQVSMDMSQTYRQASATCFPDARVVYDHFHVKKLVLDGMDEVRKEEQGKMTSRSKKAGRKLLMIPEKKMTEQQMTAAERLCQAYPRTGRAFRMVQQFDDIYKCQTSHEAERLLHKLTSWMMHSQLKPMKKVARSLRKNKEEILEYFRNRLTNAFAEGINSLIQTAKRKARGFRTFRGYRTIIFLSVGKLHLSCPNPLSY